MSRPSDLPNDVLAAEILRVSDRMDAMAKRLEELLTERERRGLEVAFELTPGATDWLAARGQVVLA